MQNFQPNPLIYFLNIRKLPNQLKWAQSQFFITFLAIFWYTIVKNAILKVKMPKNNDWFLFLLATIYINFVTTLSPLYWRLHEFWRQMTQFSDPYLEPCQGSINYVHGDEHAFSAQAKRFSRARKSIKTLLSNTPMLKGLKANNIQ